MEVSGQLQDKASLIWTKSPHQSFPEWGRGLGVVISHRIIRLPSRSQSLLLSVKHVLLFLLLPYWMCIILPHFNKQIYPEIYTEQ